jgi:hypothetical protein
VPVLSGPKWQSSGSTTTVTWSFGASSIASLDASYSGYDQFDSYIPTTGYYRALVRAAFSAWETFANIHFVEVADSAAVNIRVGNNYLDGTGTTVGLTQTWSSGGAYGEAAVEFDGDAYGSSFYAIALHEIGHALGLGHSSISGTVMYPTVTNSAGVLTSDDVAGIQSIYGGRPGAPAAPAAPVQDDYTSSTRAPGAIALGGSASGVITFAGDVDWFRLDLIQGHTYRFTLDGVATGQGTLENPVLGLVDLRLIHETSFTDTTAQYTVTESGAYYLSAQSSPLLTPGLGSYRVSAQDVTATLAADDYAADATTSGIAVINGAVTGAIENTNDKDWFKFTSVTGHSYRFDLEGAATNSGTLVNPLLQAYGNQLIQVLNVDDGGVGLNSLGQLFTLGGTYYLAASDHGSQLGTYTLRVTDYGLTSLPVLNAGNNILRVSFNPTALDLAVKVGSGALALAPAISEVVKAAAATTTVATLSYEFFTGKVPSESGINFLVATTTGNPNNINSAYYQAFNIENRYINFAVNLGVNGEGKLAFQAGYGGLDLLAATKEAYTTIFGAAPTDAKVHAMVDSRADYFAYYGGDGVNGIGAKAAMVGWLLAEAVKADVGTYAKANDAFLTDLADGANFAIDLVGVYGKPEYAFAG